MTKSGSNHRNGVQFELFSLLKRMSKSNVPSWSYVVRLLGDRSRTATEQHIPFARFSFSFFLFGVTHNLVLANLLEGRPAWLPHLVE